jgi:hypothetical protein
MLDRIPAEGTKVRTEQGEPATIYMVLPDESHAVLTMADQFMKDGGAAFRTVPLNSLTLDRAEG